MCPFGKDARRAPTVAGNVGLDIGRAQDGAELRLGESQLDAIDQSGREGLEESDPAPEKLTVLQDAERGRVGDLFMSLIHTCELNHTNPFDYLTELQRHAEELKQKPSEWIP